MVNSQIVLDIFTGSFLTPFQTLFKSEYRFRNFKESLKNLFCGRIQNVAIVSLTLFEPFLDLFWTHFEAFFKESFGIESVAVLRPESGLQWWQ